MPGYADPDQLKKDRVDSIAGQFNASATKIII